MIHTPPYKNVQKSISGKEVTVSDGKAINLNDPDCVTLICPQHGVFSVLVEDQNFMLHPSHMLILSATRTCQLNSTAGTVQIVSICQSEFHNQPETKVLVGSDLIRSLMREAICFGADPEDPNHKSAIISLLVREAGRKGALPDQIMVAMPKDRRLLKVCEELLRLPALADNVDEWCKKAGMSRRSFTRVFKIETGMSFGEWRREVRLITALSQIVDGEPIGMAAYDVGYENVSAFTAAFSRRFGVPPGHYKHKPRDITLPVFTRQQAVQHYA